LGVEESRRMRKIFLAGIVLMMSLGSAMAEEDFILKARNAIDAGLDAVAPEESERQFEIAYIAAALAADRYPDNSLPQYYLVIALVNLQRYEEAEREADIGIVKFGKPYFLGLRGEARLYLKKFNEAVKDLREACDSGDDWGCYVLEQFDDMLKKTR
jgi:tetratricopeptide (TPR) repeat protein